MNKTFTTLNIVTCALLSAVAVILASVFHHLLSDMSSLFSPMHFPVLLCGILCGQWLGLICGIVTPLVSLLATGRPPFPNPLVPMLLELAAYGFFAGLMRGIFLRNTRANRFSSVLALVVAMVLGRAVNAMSAAVFMATSVRSYFAALWVKFGDNFVSTWAAIILQLVLIPALLFALQRGGVLIKYLPDTPVWSRKRRTQDERQEQ